MAQKQEGKKVLRIVKTRFDELDMLARRGRLHPGAVVRFARDPHTLLHGSFEWDDTKAAEKYRIEQAREAIQSYVTIVSGPMGDHKVRAFYSLPSDRLSGGGYRRTSDIIKDRALLHELVASALADLERMRKNYEMVRALSPIWKAATRVKAGLRRTKKAA